jgi:hypothetical protein
MGGIMKQSQASKPNKDLRKKQKPAHNTKTIIRRPEPGSKSEAILTLAVTTPATNQEIANKVDCDKSLVTHVLARYGIERNTVETYKNNRADILAGLQEKILASINDEDIKSMPVGQRTMSYGILYDKERLERGKATSITDNKEISISVLSLFDRIKVPIPVVEGEREQIDGNVIDITPILVDNMGDNIPH